MLLLVSASTMGCRERPDDAYFRDRTLCWQELRLALADTGMAMLESGKTVADMDGRGHLHCPATAKDYSVNPEIGLWQDMGASDEVAVVCTEYHPTMPKDRQAYLAVTFDGRMIELPELPTWATP